MPTAAIYQFRLQGHLSSRWADEFSGLEIINQPDGETTLTGPVRDQAELHGVLMRIRDLNLTLLAVQRLPPGEGAAQA